MAVSVRTIELDGEATILVSVGIDRFSDRGFAWVFSFPLGNNVLLRLLHLLRREVEVAGDLPVMDLPADIIIQIRRSDLLASHTDIPMPLGELRHVTGANSVVLIPEHATSDVATCCFCPRFSPLGFRLSQPILLALGESNVLLIDTSGRNAPRRAVTLNGISKNAV